MHTNLATIHQTANGLYYLSESDFPFDAVALKTKDVVKELKKLLHYEEEPVVELTTLDHLFRNMVKEPAGANEALKKNAEGFRALKNTILENLDDVRVYRLGKVRVEIYIIGLLPDGSYGGLHTTAIET